MSLGTKQGITYYSDCKDFKSLLNPIIDNDVDMRHKGYFDSAWDQNDLTFDNFGYGLQKTRANQASLYCSNAAKLFSMSLGYVGLTLELPRNITSGVYYPLKFNGNLEFNENILWAVNMGDTSIGFPGMYAALTPEGIKFTIWNRFTQFSLLDTSSTIGANETFKIEFVWSNDGLDDFGFTDGYIPTMTIRINEVETVFGNPPLINDSIVNLKFSLLETPSTYSNLNCIIKELEIANEIPYNTAVEWYSSSSSSSSFSDYSG